LIGAIGGQLYHFSMFPCKPANPEDKRPPTAPAGTETAVCLASSHLAFQVHAGFLGGLDEAGIRPHHISGASSGAFVGGLYAAGISPEDIKKILSAGKMFRAFWEWRGPLRGLGMLANLRGVTGFLSGKKFLRYIDRFVGDLRIEDCPRARLSIAVTNLTNNAPEIIRSGPLKEFIVASCAVPCIFGAYKIGHHLYLDGAISDAAPFLHLARDPNIGTIIVHVVTHPDDPPHRRAGTIADAMGRSHQIITDRILELSVDAARRQGKRVTVLTSEVPRFRFGASRSVEPYFAAGKRTAQNHRAS
jgi:predicted acylesterase/phospholipase RssA